MQKPSKLTTRNLFDEVFAAIPADIVLNTGPASLREKYALVESGKTRKENRGTNGVDLVTEAEDHGGAVAEAPGASGGLTDEGVLDFGAVMRHAVEAESAQRHRDCGQTGRVPYAIDLQLDSEDEAVKEAMKYAALLDDVEQPQQGKLGGVNGDVSECNQRCLDTAGGSATGDVVLNREDTGDPTCASRGARRDVAEVLPLGVRVQNMPRKQLTTEEQVALMAPGDGRFHTGRCVLFRSSKNFGFIAPDIGNPDVYFTREDIDFVFSRRVLEAYFGAQVGEGSQFGGGMESNKEGVYRVDNQWSSEDPQSVVDTGADNICTNQKRDVDADSAAYTHTRRSVDGSFASETCKEQKMPITAGGSCVVTEGLPKTLVAPDQVVPQQDGEADGNEMKNDNGAVANVDVEEAESKAVDEGTEGANTDSAVTNAEKDAILRAAEHLTPEAARLLVLFFQVGQPFMLVGEPVTFTVRWNTVGNRVSRRLRAENISGLPTNFGALAVEQSWFSFIFNPEADRGKEGRGNRKRSALVEGQPTTALTESGSDDDQKCTHGEASLSEKEKVEADNESGGTTIEGSVTAKEKGCGAVERPVCSILRRYRGTIHVYDPDEHRGHIRPEINSSSTVQFTSAAFLWAPWMEAARRRPAEGLVVNYSLCGNNKGSRCTATLITATDDTALSDANMVWETRVVSERTLNSGRGADNGGGKAEKGDGDRRSGGGNGGGGGVANRDDGAKGRKRVRDEEILLLEGDDYGIM